MYRHFYILDLYLKRQMDSCQTLPYKKFRLLDHINGKYRIYVLGMITI